MFAANRWRMKTQTEQNKPHMNQTSISQEFTVSFTIIIFGVTIVYIGRLEWMTFSINLSLRSRARSMG